MAILEHTDELMIVGTGQYHEEPSADLGRLIRRLEFVLVAAVAVLVVLLGWHQRWTSDDAFINFRIVENLLHGDGPVFNPGIRVESGTSPLWLAFLAVFSLVPGIGLEWTSVFLGIGLTGVGFVLAGLGGRRLLAGRAPVVVPFGLLIAAGIPAVWDYASSGLETGLSFGWIGATWWLCTRCLDPAASRSAYLWAAVVLGLGPLVRPDEAVMTAALGVWLLVVAQGWRLRFLVLCVAATLPVGYQIFRMGYFGLLVPNTAIAKESSRALWARGFVYLLDFVHAYGLYLVAAVAAAGLVTVLLSLGGDRVRTGLVVAGLIGAAAQITYVVRVGGDFMHARMLLPGTFLALVTVAVIPVTRRGALWCMSLATVASVLATVTAVVKRVPYQGAIGPHGIADERGYWAMIAGEPRPVTLADHAGHNFYRYGQEVAALQAAGVHEVVTQSGILTPDARVSVLGPSRGRLVFLLGNAGFLGVGSGRNTLALDAEGLTDSIGAHMVAPPPGRPGHEKVVPVVWFWARYGGKLSDTARAAGLTESGVAAARAALSCGDAAKLLHATQDPMSFSRFFSNIGDSFGLTSFRIPDDPYAAERQFCG